MKLHGKGVWVLLQEGTNVRPFLESATTVFSKKSCQINNKIRMREEQGSSFGKGPERVNTSLFVVSMHVVVKTWSRQCGRT